jgi:Flp pilus assembly protein TadD
LIQEGCCGDAILYLQHADQVFPDNYGVQMSSGRALECGGRKDEAPRHLLRAAAIQPRGTIKLYAAMEPAANSKQGDRSHSLL